MADKPVPVIEKRLMEVKLGELGTWVGGRDFSPKGIYRACGRGVDAWYNKYINVRKGGFAGIAMFLTGYVVIGYIFNYSHLKHQRWRKYH
ncbi:ATP synthase F(0) complex subunit f, mitochondrial [Austrofundulus limnaeus]|uniref:ATP synthase F(0) complex subunit f, mitochondrial n=1 Tax=Austrofundulus limnaeus TaxID=52670 RepID=A0A2I4BKT3_AUSLI|nr:PREDICTED: ATP synthase subunit f, mitochondrial [Austrofundulus limnaeus]